MPRRLTRPSVGLIPTSAAADEGHTTEPSVSVPTPTAARFAAIADPVPELEPHGLRSRAYGLRHCPPRPLQPLDDWLDRKFAHSLRLVLPMITAPASRSRRTTAASRGAVAPTRVSEPAVVCMRSAVAMLYLMTTGMPCSGPRTCPALRSASSRAAIARASGLVSITARSAGPRRSIASMRARYFWHNDREVYVPRRMPSWS